MTCKDCKGTGTYVGLDKRDVCLRCSGTGVDPDSDLPKLSLTFKGQPYPASGENSLQPTHVVTDDEWVSIKPIRVFHGQARIP